MLPEQQQVTQAEAAEGAGPHRTAGELVLEDLSKQSFDSSGKFLLECGEDRSRKEPQSGM